MVKTIYNGEYEKKAIKIHPFVVCIVNTMSGGDTDRV